MTRKVQLSLAKLREAESEEARLRGGLQSEEGVKKYRGYTDEESEYRRRARATAEAENFLSDSEDESAEFMALEDEEEREFSASGEDRIVQKCISKYFSTLKNR